MKNVRDSLYKKYFNVAYEHYNAYNDWQQAKISPKEVQRFIRKEDAASRKEKSGIIRNHIEITPGVGRKTHFYFSRRERLLFFSLFSKILKTLFA